MSTGLRSQLAPKGLHFSPSEFFISDKYATILTVISYPRYVGDGYLSDITNLSGVKMVIKRMTSIGFAFTIVAFLVITNFPEFFAKMFATDTTLISLAKKTVPVYFGAMWIFGIQMCAQTTFVGLGKAKISLFIYK